MINGVKYVRASLNQETDQNDFSQGQKRILQFQNEKFDLWQGEMQL